jgi:hypothetical protein
MPEIIDEILSRVDFDSGGRPATKKFSAKSPSIPQLLQTDPGADEVHVRRIGSHAGYGQDRAFPRIPCLAKCFKIGRAHV